MPKAPVFERHLRAGSRRYQIEVRETETGNRFLLIEELRTAPVEGGQGPGSVLVFEDHAPAFADALREALNLMGAWTPVQEAANPEAGPNDAPNRGKPWTPDADAALNEAFAQTPFPASLAVQFGRSQRAIELRLEKLGLWSPEPSGRVAADAGAPWTELEDLQLEQAWFGGDDLAQLAQKLGRPLQDLQGRLEQLGWN